MVVGVLQLYLLIPPVVLPCAGYDMVVATILWGIELASKVFRVTLRYLPNVVQNSDSRSPLYCA